MQHLRSRAWNALIHIPIPFIWGHFAARSCPFLNLRNRLPFWAAGFVLRARCTRSSCPPFARFLAVFIPRCIAAADMPLAFVPQQHRLHLGVQHSVLPLEARGNILMYRRFRIAQRPDAPSRRCRPYNARVLSFFPRVSLSPSSPLITATL